MKKITAMLLLFILGVCISQAQNVTWKSDPVHSNIQFSIAHMVVSDVTGNFKEFTATVIQEKEEFTDSKVEVTIKTASIDTRVERRDNHLRSADFFDAEKFPEMTFKSTSFKKTGNDAYALTGDMMMHGITRSVVLNVKYNGQVRQDDGTIRAGFKATGSLSRYDYGLKWNRAIEAGGFLVGETVDILLNIGFIKQEESK